MYKVSEIISTPVISIYESQNQGIVYNMLFDPKTRKCKLASVLNESDGVVKILKISDIFKFGNECIFVKNGTNLELESDFESDIQRLVNPLNLSVYNMDGIRLGSSCDAIIDKNLKIVSVVLSSGNVVSVDKIFNIGKTTILVDDKKTKISRFKPRTKLPTVDKDTKVIILPEKTKPEQTQTAVVTPVTTISKIITDYRFLIGRILSKDIVAINGEIIAKNGSMVTKDIISRASLYGKLVEIARYSKKA